MCDKTSKTSVVEEEKQTNRASIDSEVFELPLSSFVLEPDYADIAKRLRLMSQSLTYLTKKFHVLVAFPNLSPLIGTVPRRTFLVS